MRPSNHLTQQRWRRFVDNVLIAGFAVIILAGGFAIAGTTIFAFPRTDEPSRSDAVLVLGPPTVQRLIMAQALVDDGFARRIVISVPDGVTSDDEHPRLRDLCRGDSDYEVECLTPEPFTTQGEAHLARRLLAANDWTSMIVVTSVTHVSRARLLFDRCFDLGNDRMEFVTDRREYDLQRWVTEFIYQAGAFVKAAINPGC